MSDLKDATHRKSSFAATLKAVFWSFFGVRKKSAYEDDAAKLNPLHVLIAAVLALVLFIFILLMIVRTVVGHL